MFKSTIKASLIASAALPSGLVAQLGLDGGFLVPEAQAVVGRPMTPISSQSF
jgi:hypothetical protein